MHRINQRGVVCLVWVTVSASTVFAQQETCEAFIKHGLYNTFHTRESRENAGTAATAYCSSYDSSRKSNTSLDTAGSAYFEMFTGHASGNRQEEDDLHTTLCTSSSTASMSKVDIDRYQNILSPGAMEVVKACVDSARDHHLYYNIKPSEETSNIVTISIAYVFGTGRPAKQHIDSVTINQEKNVAQKQRVECTGDLYVLGQQKGGFDLDSQMKTMTCTRTQSPTPFDYGNVKVFAGPVRFTVATNVQPVTMDMPVVHVSPPVKRPVSLLSEIQNGKYFTVSFGERESGFFGDDLAWRELPSAGWGPGANLLYSTAVYGRYNPTDGAWATWGPVYLTTPAIIYTSFRCGGTHPKEGPCQTKIQPNQKNLLVFGLQFRFDEDGTVYYQRRDEIERQVGRVTVY